MKFSRSSIFTGTRCPSGGGCNVQGTARWKRSRSLHIDLPALHSEGHANTTTVNKQKPHKMPHRRVLAPEMQRKDNSRCSFQQPFPPVNNPLLKKKRKENLITALQLVKKAGERNLSSLFYIYSYFWLHWVSVVVCKLRTAVASLAVEHQL